MHPRDLVAEHRLRRAAVADGVFERQPDRIGERALKEGTLSSEGRRDAEATAVPAADMAGVIKAKLGK
jgi:hypothetical protein